MANGKMSLSDTKLFFAKVRGGVTTTTYGKDAVIFEQGSPSDAVFYLQSGTIKITVLSAEGKEVVVGLLSRGDFFGEGCLVGQPVRIGSASATADCTVVRIEKSAMNRLIQDEPVLSATFVAHLLAHNIRVEADLVDQLFNSSEKRLARLLLILAHFGKEGKPEPIVPRISQETLADMIGTTRSRVSYFMNRFRQLGFIEYNGHIEVHSSLMSVVLNDNSAGTDTN